ncbi:MAG: ribbon-helix-helix protein, CopG family [Rickettsia endosymbiont of Ixodes persulcatus]|nr:ribbon-helix-helix protein, CopG family [Rickettsia endosymbiont of Ixodes persulcatus]
MIYNIDICYHMSFTMRTLVDIPDKYLNALAEIGKREKLSRAAVVREAIAIYVAKHQSKKSPDDAFGLWGKKKIDGLKYQRKIRSEW